MGLTDTELVEVKKNIQEFVSTLPMVVTTKEESQRAQVTMTTVRKEKKRREEEFKEKILNHSKKAYDTAKATWEAHKRVLVDLIQPFTDWEAQTNSNILAWEAKVRKRIKLEQEIENRKYAERMAKAEAKGREPESVRPPKLVQAAPKTIKSEAWAFTIKEEKELVVFDETQIPERYWIKTLNKKMVEGDLRAGIAVPGAILEERLRSAIRG